jgi:hypothetical protein
LSGNWVSSIHMRGPFQHPAPSPREKGHH